MLFNFLIDLLSVVPAIIESEVFKSPTIIVFLSISSMDREDVVYIYNGILLSHKKE